MDFDHFLKAALPPLGCEWRRHRRKGVRRKVLARTAALGINDLSVYLDVLRADPAEVEVFKGLLTVTISRFYRDPQVFGRLTDSVLPGILERYWQAGIWSAGAASGEEPYTLAVITHEYFTGKDISIIATDIDEECMARARAGLYGESSLKRLPPELRERYFTKTKGGWLLKQEIRERVLLLRHDIRRDTPFSDMDIVLCRNLAYTYFDTDVQMDVTRRLHSALRRGGALVIGRTESLPPGTEGLFAPLYIEERIYRKL